MLFLPSVEDERSLVDNTLMAKNNNSSDDLRFVGKDTTPFNNLEYGNELLFFLNVLITVVLELLGDEHDTL